MTLGRPGSGIMAGRGSMIAPPPPSKLAAWDGGLNSEKKYPDQESDWVIRLPNGTIANETNTDMMTLFYLVNVV